MYITKNQSFCKLDFQKMKKTLFSLMVLLFTSSFAFSTTHYVNSGNFYYSPSNLTINVGDTVTWINDGGFHNVNFDVSAVTGQSYNNPEVFVSNPTSGNILYTHVFTTAGNYTYDCSVGSHANNGMVGYLTVNANSNSSASLISDCSDFVSGPSAWPYVLVATTIADGAASQGSQTFEMNVTSLPAGGRILEYLKQQANGNSFFGNPVALSLGVNTITVAAVTFDRAVKFQFSSGDVEFDALTLNGVASSCVGTTPPPTTSLISDCGDFVSGPSAWPYVLVATTIADGAASQGSQTFEMNVTSLPAGGANFRVYKTTS